MAISEQMTVEVAAVHVNDEYRVQLDQVRKHTDYSPEQAEDLAAELLNAATEARRMVERDAVVAASRIRAANYAMDSTTRRVLGPVVD